MSRLSRKHEYEADHLRGCIRHAAPLVQSLRKLHKENLSNLVRDRFYSAFYYSHPTLLGGSILCIICDAIYKIYGLLLLSPLILAGSLFVLPL